MRLLDVWPKPNPVLEERDREGRKVESYHICFFCGKPVSHVEALYSACPHCGITKEEAGRRKQEFAGAFEPEEDNPAGPPLRRLREAMMRDGAREMGAWLSSESQETQQFFLSVISSFPCDSVDALGEYLHDVGIEPAPLGWQERSMLEKLCRVDNCDEFDVYLQTLRMSLREHGTPLPDEPEEGGE